MTGLTGLECGGFGEDISTGSSEDQIAGRVLRVSQSAPQVEFVDSVDAPGVRVDFSSLGALGTSSEGMITGSAPQQLIEEMSQPTQSPQEGEIN